MRAIGAALCAFGIVASAFPEVSLAQAQEAPAARPEGVTQAEVDAVAQQQRHFDDLERTRREDAAQSHQTILHFGVGYGESGAPRANYGFVRDGPPGTAPDLPAAYSEERIPMLTVVAGGEFRGIGRFELSYGEGDADNHVDIAQGAAGTARGAPYTATSPGGSTGVGGNVALEVTTETRVQQVSGTYGYYDIGEFSLNPFDVPGTSTRRVTLAPDLSIGLGFGVDLLEREHDGETQIHIPVEFSQVIHQRLNEHMFRAFGGLDAAFPLGSGAHFRTEVQVGGYYFDTDLVSEESVRQNFGPTADRAFTTTLEDSDSGVGFRVDAGAELGFGLGGAVEAFLAGSATYFSHRAQVVNPSSGDFVLDGGTTFLDAAEALDWQVMLGVRIGLGDRAP
jgi:hypothetical protein